MPDSAGPKSNLLGPLMKGVIGLSLGLLGFVASLIWKGYERIEEGQASIEERLSTIEQDNAKWATLASMEERLMELRTRVEVMRQVWSYEYEREIPTGFEKKPGAPVLTPPEELFRDVEKYRNMQQQRIPQKKFKK